MWRRLGQLLRLYPLPLLLSAAPNLTAVLRSHRPRRRQHQAVATPSTHCRPTAHRYLHLRRTCACNLAVPAPAPSPVPAHPPPAPVPHRSALAPAPVPHLPVPHLPCICAGAARHAPTDTYSASLSWSVPQFNTDGTSLTDVSGYRVYYGKNPSNLSASVLVPGMAASSHVITGLGAGTYYFAVATLSLAGEVSELSNVASKTFP